MSTLRVSNIEAKADPSSSTVDEQVKITNSNGDVLLYVDGRTSGITTVGINTTAQSFEVDSNNNFNFTGIVTATSFSGPLTGNVTGNVTGTASQLETNATGANLTLSGNLGVGGTITYEDVARVDATGISTFREGLKIGPLAGIALTAYTDGSIRTSGIITASSFSGTVASSNLSGALPALDGSALTGVGASFANSSINTSGIITATAFIPSQGQLFNKNLIINGEFRVAQRGWTTNTGTGNFAAYCLDQWKVSTYLTDQLNLTVTREAMNQAVPGFANYMKVSPNAAESGGHSAEYSHIRHSIEAQDCQRLKWGTSSAESATLSFWVKSNVTGVGCINFLKHDATQKQITRTYTINVADTWEKKTVTIPGNTSSGIANDNGIGINIYWFLDAGSSYKSSDSTSWQNFADAGYAYGHALNLIDSTSSYLALAGVQFEIGSVATPFEHRSYADDLKRCERYFQLLLHPDSGTEDMGSGFASSANEVQFPLQFKTEMRANPTIWQVSGSNYFLIGAGSYGGDKYLSASWNVNNICKISGSLYTDPDANLSSHISSMGLIQGKSTSARLGLQAEL